MRYASSGTLFVHKRFVSRHKEDFSMSDVQLTFIPKFEQSERIKTL